MAPHLLSVLYAPLLLVLDMVVHSAPSLWSRLTHGYDSGLRPKADLLLQEVFELLAADALVCSCVNPSDQGEEFSFREEKTVSLHEAVEVYNVNSTIVHAINGSIKA